ncbi:MAG: translation initiation factor IF-2 N-terminal domain-containing protein, partial [Muriicola sp.]|nr:translation initiation factor IF-2 N-terminal domain-containing protein [Muriicola sp.]
MSDTKTKRLNKIARELNVGISTIVEFLQKKGVKIESNPNAKITSEQYDLLLKEFSTDLNVKKESEKLILKNKQERLEAISLNDVGQEQEPATQDFEEEVLVKNLGATVSGQEPEADTVQQEKESIKVNVVGKIDVDKLSAPKKKVSDTKKKSKDTETPKEVEKESKDTQEPEPEKETEVSASELIENKESEDTDELMKSDIRDVEVKVVGKIDLTSMNQRTRPPKKTKAQLEEERKSRAGAQKKKKEEPEVSEGKKDEKTDIKGKAQPEVYKTKREKLDGPKVVGKMVLSESEAEQEDKSQKKKRKRIKKDTTKVSLEKGLNAREGSEDQKDKKKKKKRKGHRFEISEEDVDKQIKDTFARLSSKGRSKGAKYRREKRDLVSQRMQEEVEKKEQEKNVLKVTEFVTVNELATLMGVPANEVIAACMSLGLFVSINQRLDAEALVLVAEEFNYKIEFVTADVQEEELKEEEDPELLSPRSPIVTVMGHVDHGKTKLLDHIRKANVVAGEAGGITQHIGAYGVQLKDGREITFLDTPGHEAFTAMRARGAQITDVAIIVVAADDGIMPQTVEAINHAQAAGVPMVFAINKIDKPTANPDKIKEALANMNILVEDWGGKFQSQEISAKNGLNVDDLLEKVLLEAEMLGLKANPDKQAVGTIIE